MPLVERQNLDLNEIDLIAYTDIRTNDNPINRKKGVHFLLTIIILRVFIVILNDLLEDFHSTVSC